MLLISPPAWVSEPPQNTDSYYYGVGIASGSNVEAIEKAKLKALQDLSSRLFITIDAQSTETRSTIQKNTFFGKVQDTQDSEQNIEISCYLTDIPGISHKRIEITDGMVFCWTQLDRLVLRNFFYAKFESLLMEASCYPLKSQSREEKLYSLRTKLNKAQNLGVPTYNYEVRYNVVKFGMVPPMRRKGEVQ